MKNKNLCIFFIVACVFLFIPMFYVYGEEEIRTDEKELKELYKKLKEEKGKDVDVYYRKEIITKEPKKEEYLEHLLNELKRSLEKGKKWGKVRRVEGKLVEIDKGAVHKVHERDVFIIYDSNMNYKGKVEIEAIADAISIGNSYEQKRKIEPGDTIKFRGQRRFMEISLAFGDNRVREEDERYSGLGTFWKYNFRGGYGIDFLLSFIEKIDNTGEFGVNKSMLHNDLYKISFCLGAKKYFLFPSIVSPFIGSGISLSSLGYNYQEREQGIITKREELKKNMVMPYFSSGVQLFSGQQVHVDLESRYFYGPKLDVVPEPIKIRPIIHFFSVSFTW